MSSLGSLTKRGLKLFFKDKGMLFSSLITPLILLVLYITFLAKVYKDSFLSSLEAAHVADFPQELIDATVGGQLFSSLLAVCCITVAFCCNMTMVQDKVTGARKDLMMTPVKKSTLALSYYLSTFISTFIICLIAEGASFIYLANVGWYLSASDILLSLLDVFLLVMFGTALSSIVNFFLTSQGQISAVGTVVSAGYGFICGAYMPISQFGGGLQKVLSFLPGTYGTALIRSHSLAGVFREMSSLGFPNDVVENIRKSIDCSIYFFGNKVEVGAMYAIFAGSVVAFIGIYILLNILKKGKR